MNDIVLNHSMFRRQHTDREQSMISSNRHLLSLLVERAEYFYFFLEDTSRNTPWGLGMHYITRTCRYLPILLKWPGICCLPHHFSMCYSFGTYNSRDRTLMDGLKLCWPHNLQVNQVPACKSWIVLFLLFWGFVSLQACWDYFLMHRIDVLQYLSDQMQKPYVICGLWTLCPRMSPLRNKYRHYRLTKR